MIMSMMHVRHVGVGVNQRCVFMPMGVRFRIGNVGLMSMLMMLFVNMGMGMRQGFMTMFMFVMLAQVQPNAYDHEGCSRHELCG